LEKLNRFSFCRRSGRQAFWAWAVGGKLDLDELLMNGKKAIKLSKGVETNHETIDDGFHEMERVKFSGDNEVKGVPFENFKKDKGKS
jgi:hypothetical protein